MAYRYGNREQTTILPNSVEDYIGPDDPVRAYDAFVASLDFKELGIVEDDLQVGCPEYDPRAMLKLLVYGYSYGIRSSRKLERAVHHNLSFIWLLGGLNPDHKTIANFRRRHRAGLQKVLRLCARFCMKLGLIEGNTLFVDGTKLRANGSLKHRWTPERCKQALEGVDKRIESLLAECETIDTQEQHDPSLVKLQEKLGAQRDFREKVAGLMKQLEDEDKQAINTVDPDAVPTRSTHGSYSGYNAQIVVDEKNGLIASSDVVTANNDRGQFAQQITQATEVLGKACEQAVADCGYDSIVELKQIEEKGIVVIVPSERQMADKEQEAFSKDRFVYDAKKDSYVCPGGNVLRMGLIETNRRRKKYRIAGSICRSCEHFGVCTVSKAGRCITRLFDEELVEKLEARFKDPQYRTVYDRRKEKVELPFGHLRRNLGVDSFLLRGLEGVRAEMSLLSSCFNIRRMITILGVQKLVALCAV